MKAPWIGLFGLALCALAGADPVPPPAPLSGAAAQAATDPVLEARLRHLEEELRCLVCQNQTLADSNAGLAEDLRREIRELARAGKTDAEIKDYLHERYGNFVLYRPPFEPETWLLWVGPFGLLAASAGYLIWRARRPGAASTPELAEGERRAVERLLE